MHVKRFGVSLENTILEKLDQFVTRRRFPNRSQAIRYLIEQATISDKWNEDEDVAGSIVLVYNHKKRELSSQTTSLQHEYHCLVLSVQHVHLNDDFCLETIAVKGKAGKLRKLADKLIAIKGIKHGELVMATM